jgi:hypothetical protein
MLKVMTVVLAEKASSPSKPRAIRSEVKGPIRCHKCQLNCRDAAEYRGHKCEPKPQPE